MTYTIIENGVLRDATEEEILEIQRCAADADANALAVATAAFNLDRQTRLSETDWWAIRASETNGTPMTEAQLSYRAALRAMDDANGFDPFNPIWPESPTS